MHFDSNASVWLKYKLFERNRRQQRVAMLAKMFAICPNAEFWKWHLHACCSNNFGKLFVYGYFQLLLYARGRRCAVWGIVNRHDYFFCHFLSGVHVCNTNWVLLSSLNVRKSFSLTAAWSSTWKSFKMTVIERSWTYASATVGSFGIREDNHERQHPTVCIAVSPAWYF